MLMVLRYGIRRRLTSRLSMILETRLAGGKRGENGVRKGLKIVSKDFTLTSL
jgi:hypothetical protein